MTDEKIPDANINQEGSAKAEIDTGLDAVGVEAPAQAATAEAKAGKQAKDLTKLKVEKSCSRGLAGWLVAKILRGLVSNLLAAVGPRRRPTVETPSVP